MCIREIPQQLRAMFAGKNENEEEDEEIEALQTRTKKVNQQMLSHLPFESYCKNFSDILEIPCKIKSITKYFQENMIV